MKEYINRLALVHFRIQMLSFKKIFRKFLFLFLIFLFISCKINLNRNPLELYPIFNFFNKQNSTAQSNPTQTGSNPVRFTIGGTVTGLTASGLTILSGTNPNYTIDIAAGATSFQVPDTFSTGSNYSFAIVTVPAGLSCALSNQSGTVDSANVTNISVYCFSSIPSVIAISPADGSTNVAYNSNVSLTFSSPMNISTLTVNSVDNLCNATVQISEDNFVTCIPINSSTAGSSNNTVFTFTPLYGFTFYKTARIKVNTNAMNILSNNLASIYTSTGFTGFTVAGLRIHYQAHTIYQANSTAVSSWNDMSGNNNSLAQVSAPTFLTSQIGQFPVVRFNTTTSRMKKIGGTTGLTTLAGSYFLVFRRNATLTNVLAFEIGADPSYTSGRQILFNSSDIIQFVKTGVSTMATSLTAYTGTSNVYLFSTQSDGTNHDLQFNGNADGTGVYAASTYAGSDIDLSFSGLDWAEILYFDNMLNSSQKDLVNCYLGKKYSIPISISCP